MAEEKKKEETLSPFIKHWKGIVFVVVALVVAVIWSNTAREGRRQDQIRQAKAEAERIKQLMADCPLIRTPLLNERFDAGNLKCIRVKFADETGWIRRPDWAVSANIHPSGLVRITKMNGDFWDDAPGQINAVNVGNQLEDTPEDQMVKFISLTGQEITVTMKFFPGSQRHTIVLGF